MTATIPSLRDSEAKLQHILQHSAQIFANQGFEGSSIRDISRATGISLSGLYYYFESKQKLLYLIQINAFTSILERAKARLAGVDDAQTRLRILVQNHVEYFLSHPSEMKVLAHEEDALERPYRDEIAAIKRRYYALAREIFEGVAGGMEEREEGEAEGAGARAGQQSRVNARVAVLSLFGMMNWIYKWHNPKVDPDAEQLAETVVNIFLHGVVGASERERVLAAAGAAPLTSD